MFENIEKEIKQRFSHSKIYHRCEGKLNRVSAVQKYIIDARVTFGDM